jgi:hypothetical protein
MMKKIILLSVIIGLFLTLNISAQIGKPKSNGLNVQQKMLPFAMGMSLCVLRERYDENHYEVIASLQRQIRYWSEELKPVVDLRDEKNNYIRRDVLDKALKDLQAKSSQSDRWKMLIGDHFGSIFVEIKKAEDNNEAVDSEQVKFYVDLIGKMSLNPPQEIPSNVVDKFNKFGKLAEMEDFSSDANIKLLASRVINILDEITQE